MKTSLRRSWRRHRQLLGSYPSLQWMRFPPDVLLCLHGNGSHLNRCLSFRLLRFCSSLLQGLPHACSQGEVLSQGISAYFFLQNNKDIIPVLFIIENTNIYPVNAFYLTSTSVKPGPIIAQFWGQWGCTSPTGFSIITHSWQLNSNHYVNFLAWLQGMVACMPVTSLESYVHRAVIDDWHSLQQSS